MTDEAPEPRKVVRPGCRVVVTLEEDLSSAEYYVRKPDDVGPTRPWELHVTGGLAEALLGMAEGETVTRKIEVTQTITVRRIREG